MCMCVHAQAFSWQPSYDLNFGITLFSNMCKVVFFIKDSMESTKVFIFF